MLSSVVAVILKQKALVCQFAPPLDVDQHNKPEAVVMEGKYWKRKLSTVAAEYKKWRLFYRNKIMGWTHHMPADLVSLGTTCLLNQAAG